jgi:hypothetical protein
MIDAVSILFTSGFLLYIAYKAYKLDRASKVASADQKISANSRRAALK